MQANAASAPFGFFGDTFTYALFGSLLLHQNLMPFFCSGVPDRSARGEAAARDAAMLTFKAETASFPGRSVKYPWSSLPVGFGISGFWTCAFLIIRRSAIARSDGAVCSFPETTAS